MGNYGYNDTQWYYRVSPYWSARYIKKAAIVLYDSGDQDVLLAMVTSQEYTTETDYKILDWQKSGLLAESYIRLGKQATIEKQFIIRKLGTLKAKDIEVLKSILKGMFYL